MLTLYNEQATDLKVAFSNTGWCHRRKRDSFFVLLLQHPTVSQSTRGMFFFEGGDLVHAIHWPAIAEHCWVFRRRRENRSKLNTLSIELQFRRKFTMTKNYRPHIIYHYVRATERDVCTLYTTAFNLWPLLAKLTECSLLSLCIWWSSKCPFQLNHPFIHFAGECVDSTKIKCRWMWKVCNYCKYICL